MVDDRVEHVLREMEVRGITVIRGGDEAEHHLWSVRARAAYLPVDGEPGVVITGTRTTYADALHEAYHSSQHEARNWRAWDSAEKVMLEIGTYVWLPLTRRVSRRCPYRRAYHERTLIRTHRTLCAKQPARHGPLSTS